MHIYAQCYVCTYMCKNGISIWHSILLKAGIYKFHTYALIDSDGWSRELLNPTSSIRVLIEQFVVGKMKCVSWIFFFLLLLLKISCGWTPKTDYPNPWGLIEPGTTFCTTEVHCSELLLAYFFFFYSFPFLLLAYFFFHLFVGFIQGRRLSK